MPSNKLHKYPLSVPQKLIFYGAIAVRQLMRFAEHDGFKLTKLQVNILLAAKELSSSTGFFSKKRVQDQLKEIWASD